MNEEFLLLLQAGIDEAASKGRINEDIQTTLQGKVNELKLQATLDEQSVKNIISEIEGITKQKINIDIDSSSIKQAEQIGQKISQAISKSSQKNVNMDKLNADVKALTNNLNNFSSKNDGFSKFKTDINGVEISLNSLISKLSAVDNTADLSTICSEANALKTAFMELSRINEIQLAIDNGHGASEYQNRINSIIVSLERYGVETKEAQTVTSSLQSTFDSMKGLSGQELITQAEKLEQEFKAVKASVEEAKLSYDKLMQPASKEKITSTLLKVQKLLNNNTKVTEEVKNEWQSYVNRLSSGSDIAVKEINDINLRLKETESTMSSIGKLGLSWTDKLKQTWKKFGSLGVVTGAMTTLFSQTKSAISELKEINTLLTEISKANDKLSKSDLNNIGNNSFDVASKYGKQATDYLSGIQEASRAGYENAEGIAELSVAAQGAGDMTAELANKYIIATDKAYKMNGSIEALTETLDGANSITNHNAVNMTELAEGMTVVGSQAASSQMKINETTAAIGTMIAVTQKSGSEMGNAFKGILMNLQQVTGEVEDGGDAIDETSLTKYEKACNELGVSLSTVKDGVVSLKEPMQILKELAAEYTKLDESDAKRANLLSAVGGKYRANALNAILENYNLYEKMLQDYADGTGSMAIEAEKTANSWEGSMNRIGNTWKDTIDNIVNSDAVITVINSLNSLLTVVNNITDKLGSLGTIGLGAGIFAGVKEKSGGLIMLIPIISNSPFLATVEFNSDVYDSYVYS